MIDLNPLNYRLQIIEGSRSFSNPIRSVRGIARAHRNNMIEELTYGSYLASIRSELEKEKHLVTGVAYHEAVSVWQSLGLSEPSFIASINPEKFLTETATSINRRLRLKFTFGVFPAFVLSIFFGILAADSNREHKKAGIKRYLIVDRIFMSLAGLSVLFMIAFIGFCVFV